MNNKYLLLLTSLIMYLTGCSDDTPFEPSLSVTPSKLAVFSSDGGTNNASVDSNLEWVATPSASWITVSPSSGDGDITSVAIQALVNEYYDGREGHVIFRNAEFGVSDTVYVSQVQKDAILLAADTYEIGSEGGDITFEVSSNVNFHVYSDQTWVKQTKSRGLVQTELSFTVEANTNIEARTATLTLKTSSVEQKITIQQAGYDDTEERNALIALYNATDGDNWKDNTNWCSDKPLSEWYGVSVNSANRVRTININYNNLSGSIPAEISKLTYLEFFQLYSNQLTGNIPVELCNLPNLKTLSLGYNELTGSIPVELCNLSNLETLNLNGNQLTGSIPAELGNLSNLKYLSLGNNKLTGCIPPELGNLSNLEYLDLYYNELSGSIPAELGNATNLQSLYLFYNQLTGEIPEFIGNMESYQSVYLYYNYFEGEPPAKVTEHADWHIYWPRLVSGTKVNLTKTDINAPEFTVTDMDGNTVGSDELYKKNTITILYKWGKWCGYSLEYNETLKKIYEQYHDKGLEIFGSYNLYSSETESEIKEYIDENIPWPNHFIRYKNEDKGIEANLITQFGLIGAVPEIIVVDSNKKVIFQGFTENRFDLPLILAEYF